MITEPNWISCLIARLPSKSIVEERKLHQCCKFCKCPTLPANTKHVIGPPGTAEEDSEGDDTVLGELPLEVLQHMFSLLDPVTLGAASCVCTTWHNLSQDETLWKRCLAQVALGSSSSSHSRSASCRQQFNAVVSSEIQSLILHRYLQIIELMLKGCRCAASMSWGMWL